MAKCVIKTTSKPLNVTFNNRQSSNVPEIEREFLDDGKKYYKTKDGRVFDADIFDANFKVERRTVKKKNYKGTISGHRERMLKVKHDLKRYGKFQ